MELRLDHVTVAGRDLDELQETYTKGGLTAEYGGKHSNGVTHMAVVGFRDGSYVELISAFDESARSPWWHDPIHADGGPCAWAVRVDDIASASATLRDRGVTVDGPHEYQRERADGAVVEWELTFLGDGDPGHTLPFLIEDVTPRERRVTPTGDLADSPLVGVDTVVLAVADRERAVDRFRTAFDLGSPRTGFEPEWAADVASFTDAPVVLAEPTGPGWLADRLDAFGPRPAAYLLGTTGETSLDVASTESFVGREVAWLSLSSPLDRPYLGLVDR